MANKKQQYDFAVEYLNLYNSIDSTIEDVCEGFAEKCWELGYEMDCGNSFQEQYPKAFHSSEELLKVINSVDNPTFLGTAIFSHWRYVTHWSYGSNPLEEHYRPWFKIAFQRLVEITSEDGSTPFDFQGQLKKIQVYSHALGYGPCPKPEDEIAQKLTINAEGQVWITKYAFGVCGVNKKIGSIRLSIEKEQVDYLFSKYEKCFSENPLIPLATDVGDFNLCLTNTDGCVFKFKGSLIPCYEIDGKYLSDWTRDILDRPDLFVFDGNATDRIERIRIDYYRKSIIHNIHEDTDFTWEYDEYIIIDRSAENIELYRKIGSDCNIKQVYHIGSGIGTFLDDCCSDMDFEDIEGIADDAILPSNEIKNYTLTIDYFLREQLIIKGRYSKKSLPKTWATFMTDLIEFLEFYGIGEIMDPLHYNKEFKTPSSIIYLSVVFGDSGKRYYYKTEDDTIEVGDQVVVPVGNNGKERIVDVVKKSYFQTDDVPMSIDKVKDVIAKFELPPENENGDRMIYCSLLNKDITADDCYTICVEGDLHEFHDIDGLVSKEEYLAREDICKNCKYNCD